MSSTTHALNPTERFERVVLPHLNEMRRLARSLTSSGADADDVLQEANVRLLRFINGYRGGDARSWVLRVARNTAFSWLRANRRWPEAATEAEVNECEDLFAIEARRRDGEALRRVIGTLPREQRDIVVLRDLNGFQYSEIAALLGIPIGTVMSRLSRGRAVLQERLLSGCQVKEPLHSAGYANRRRPRRPRDHRPRRIPR